MCPYDPYCLLTFTWRKFHNAQDIYPWHEFEIGLRLQPHLPGANQLSFRRYATSLSLSILRWSTGGWIHLRMMTSSNGNIFPRYWPFVRGIHRGPGEFPTQRPVTRSFDVFFDLRLNKRLGKQSWGWWFETLSCPLWRHCNSQNRLLDVATKVTP